MKNELKVHLNALKSYVDMKFDVLKGTMSGKGKGGKKTEAQMQSLTSTLMKSMANMDKL